MSQNNTTGCKIIGTGNYLPKNSFNNDYLRNLVDTNDEWIQKRTGIKKRHIATANETCWQMGLFAAKEAISNAGKELNTKISLNDIGIIITATCTPDNVFPSNSCFIKNKLGITNNSPAFDINAACSGFIYALDIAYKYMTNSNYKYALVIGSERMSKLINWNDRNTCVLFGDGAGAVLLAKDQSNLWHTNLHSNGQLCDLLQVEHCYNNTDEQINKIFNFQQITENNNSNDDIGFIKMNGREVFKNAVNLVGNSIKEILVDQNISSNDIDYFIPHQANIRIIQSLSEKIGLEEKKIIKTIAEQANTSAASIPLALHDGVISGKISRGQLLLLCAFGAGLSWSTALFKY